MSSLNPLIIIPVRIGSTRLPRKPLADIHGKPMIQHVWERAIQSQVGPVVIATDDAHIAQVIQGQGGHVVMTPAELPSGSDRVHHALQQVDPSGKHDVVINLQGDLPNIDVQAIRDVMKPLTHTHVDVATLAAPMTDPEDIQNPNIVKIAMADQEGVQVALYFSRSPIPHGEGPYYHHIGLYAYRRPFLQKFVDLPPSTLELRERLEQLRLVEKGVRFGVGLVDAIPQSVDTPDDLVKVCGLMA
jgi:3-deoxy-manno-octulosonate cytidylyltransferase (CMP-KDO synthetase)